MKIHINNSHCVENTLFNEVSTRIVCVLKTFGTKMRKRQRFNECKLKICTGCAAIIPCFIYRYISVVIKPVLANKAFFVEWKIGLAMSFNLTGENGADNEIPLTDYNGSTVYRHMAGLAQDIEPALRHMLESSLLYLNTWMNRQANNH